MFYCDCCGCCCRSIKDIPYFKEMDRGDGVCIHLDDATNLCNIYNHRPILCRVDECYEAYFSTRMSRQAYEKMNYEACEMLKKRFGISKKGEN